jgi:hypothetical protein
MFGNSARPHDTHTINDLQGVVKARAGVADVRALVPDAPLELRGDVGDGADPPGGVDVHQVKHVV